MKVITVVGTRPELIKLSCVIKRLDKFFDHILVHTGQNFDYELNEIFYEELGIRKPDYFLNAASENFAYTISNVLSKSYDLFIQEKPDAILVYGDTNSSMCVIIAKRLKIPIFHMEAGNRSFDQRVPEELNRKIADHVSDINMPISDHGKEYLISEGIPSNTIIKVGSSMSEVLNEHMKSISSSDVLSRLDLQLNDYFVVSLHREENVDNYDNLKKIVSGLEKIVNKYRKKIIFSIHPRTRDRLKKFNLIQSLPKDVIQSKPLGFYDYIKLQINSFCVISDSGTIFEESSILGFPAITVRQSHERPEAMEEGTLIMTGFNPENILSSIDVVTSDRESDLNIVSDYMSEKTSEKVLRVILSYTDFVNRETWKKY